MKVYIIGVVSNGDTLSLDQQRENAKRFDEAEERLRAEGHEPVNPLKLSPVGSLSWLDAMRKDIKALVDCEAVYHLKGWEDGRGTWIESNLAEDLGLEEMYE